MTGTSSAFGPPLEKAARMAVTQVNDAAKKAGVELEVRIVTADNESEPVASVAAARKLTTEGASCMVGSSSSATTIAVAQSVAIPQGIPMITPMSTAASITDLHANGGVTFRTIPADPLQAKVLTDVIAERVEGAEGKTISIAGRDDAFGQGLTAEIKRNWEALGGQANGPLLYNPNASSYNDVAGEIVAGDPAAYVVIDLPQTYAKVGAALLRTGEFSADDLFIAGGQPATIPEDTPPEALNGAVGRAPGSPPTVRSSMRSTRSGIALPARRSSSRTCRTASTPRCCAHSARSQPNRPTAARSLRRSSPSAARAGPSTTTSSWTGRSPTPVPVRTSTSRASAAR